MRFERLRAITTKCPVLEPEALALLSRYDKQALHFDTASFVA
jgi:hypothetical protein